MRVLGAAKVRRMLRWEFWPLWLFYLPVAAWILLLGLRYRSPLLFTAANPGMPVGGLMDIDKSANLLALQRAIPQAVAKTRLLPAGSSGADALTTMTEAGLNFPVVLKPNSGQRGLGVEVVANRPTLDAYCARYSGHALLLQEYVAGEEFGVFYMREPDKTTGNIFSINKKTFPRLRGDGTSTVEQLILAAAPTHCRPAHFLRAHAERLAQVPAPGAEIPLVEVGSHCRGAVFFDGAELITPALEAQIDTLSKAIGGYYFGRYDLRAPTAEDLRAGRNIKVLEVNGVSSESANIYDPAYGLLHAYRVLFAQWSMAFRVGAQCRRRGHRPASWREPGRSGARLNSPRRLHRRPK